VRGAAPMAMTHLAVQEGSMAGRWTRWSTFLTNSNNVNVKRRPFVATKRQLSGVALQSQGAGVDKQVANWMWPFNALQVAFTV
jgi:hypothetical protein